MALALAKVVSKEADFMIYSQEYFQNNSLILCSKKFRKESYSTLVLGLI